MSITTSTGALIFFSTVIIYWGIFIYYVVDIGISQGEGVIGIMFGFLIPLIIVKYLSDKCQWDWT